MNDHLAPIFQAALAPFAPHVQPLKPYMVRIFRGAELVNSFEAFAPDSCACVMQHADLCAPGDKLDVMGLESWYEQQREQKAAALDVLAADVADVVSRSTR